MPVCFVHTWDGGRGHLTLQSDSPFAPGPGDGVPLLCLPHYTAGGPGSCGCGEERLLPVREARFLPEADGILTHPGAERQKLPFRRLPSAIFSRQVLQGSLTFCDLTAQLRRAPAHCSLSHTHTLAHRQLFRYICDCVQYSTHGCISKGAL